MSETIDARGLSCPQPVLLTLNGLGSCAGDVLEVLVDTDTAKENVSRAARKKGWTVREVVSEGDGYRLALARG